MQAKNKYNQIESWFTTPEPELKEPELKEPVPKELPPVPSRAFMIFKVICSPIIIYFLIRWAIWQFHDDNSFSDFVDRGKGFFDELIRIPIYLGSLLCLFLIGVPAFIFAVFLPFRSIFKFREMEKARAVARAKAEEAEAKARAEYDAARTEYDAEYDVARTEYDSLPSISQMEQWLEEDIENLKQSSLQKTGLDESEIVAEPVMTTVASSGPSNMIKETEHGHSLSSHWDLTILYISEGSIVVYRCEYDWTKNKSLNDSTTEYFYPDIVAVERRTVESDEIIIINLSSGSSVSITLNGQGSTELSSRVDKAAQGIRRLLKDRK